MRIQVIKFEKGWTFYMFTQYCAAEGNEIQCIRRCDVYSMTNGKMYRCSLHTIFTKTAASMNIRPVHFTAKERKSIVNELRDFRHSGNPFIYFNNTVVCYKVQDLINILSQINHPDLPKRIVEKLEERIFSAKNGEPVPLRKRKREQEEEQVEIVSVTPKLWPKDIVEYGNAMRIFHGVEKKDFTLPPVSPNVELFELPTSHPAYGRGQNIGVRAVQDIAKGEELMHYAGLIEPFLDNGLPNMYVMHDPDETYNCQHNALSFGNEARYINAYNNVQDKPNVKYGDEFSQIASRRSYNFVRSCPVVAIADIKKGEELLVDYGDGYWDHPSFKKTAEVTSQKEEKKFSDLKILEIVTDETIIAKLRPALGIKKYYLCSYCCNGEKCHRYLTPSQVNHILEHMYPQFQPKSVIEYTGQTTEGHVTKELCFFNGFVVDKNLTDFIGVELSNFGNPDMFFHRSINRISLPKMRKHIGKAKSGDTVFVQDGDHQLKMATLVSDEWSFANDIKVRIFGDLDPDTLLPAVKSVYRLRVFEQ